MIYVSTALALYIIFREMLMFFERRDLYRRIMSASLREYDAKNAAAPRSSESPHTRSIKKWRHEFEIKK